jgi:hypothetical protein
VEGPFEKIYFQQLLHQYPLQTIHLVPQSRRGLSLRSIGSSFSRQVCHDIVTLCQPVHGYLPKGFWILFHAFSVLRILIQSRRKFLHLVR